MKKCKTKDKRDNEKNLWQIAVDAMCSSLDKFGRYEILTLLVANAHRDEIVNRLLITYPGLAAAGEFLRNFRFNVKVSKRLFKKLEKEHCIL